MKSNYCTYVEKGARIVLYDIDSEIYVYAKPCCMVSHTLIPAEISKPYKLDSVDSLMTLESLRYYRDYFDKNDTLHPACKSCIDDESKGLTSLRQQTNQQDFKDYDISKLDVLIGRSCNLACPFCFSDSSSLIDNLARTLDQSLLPSSWKPLSKSFLPVSKKTSEVIANILKNYKVGKLKIVGGEPFLKENWNNIFKVIEEGYTKNTSCTITTNGTVLNDRILKNLQKNEYTHLTLSVDSIGKNYEFIRWPYKWNKIDKKLKYLRDNISENLSFNISVLINVFNFEFLPDIEKYFLEITDSVEYSVNIMPATHLMNYKNLPNHLIDNVREKVISNDLKKILVNTQQTIPRDILKREFTALLAQRQMNAKDVIGPITREYLDL